ncbi:putative porin [Mariniflexile litorale]|uniref:Porin n=1 Tax=Mariniflexile litorale TaxID=3045158 RepID=A0AAU7EB11_9FLAO|nr:putative porin [Mariniflexile sp. KMM 9835]MDQ8213376.1 putative porin [Mariniflexile sp. KMM 9835]
MISNKKRVNKNKHVIKLLVAIFLILQFNQLFAQNKPKKSNRLGRELGIVEPKDSLAKENLPKITDYLIISYANDTTYVDTTLSIKKEYKFNYLRKDNFGLMPFSNMGQTYNSLTYNFQNTNLMPSFGAQAKHFFYMEVEDINYYHVPTPLTELFFKTAFEQGQQTDAFFTVNTSPEYNFSIAYKGLRSLGKYQNILTSSGNFRFTSNYVTKNKKYNAKAHIVTQDLLNQENGGLQDDNVVYFETGDPEFLDRSIFEVNFEDAESMLKAKRFYLDHAYHIIKRKDSLSKNKLNIGHIISFDDKYYQYNQSSANSFFGDAFKTSTLKDRATLESFYNQLQLNYSNNILGDLQFNISSNNYNYGYDKLVVLNGERITNRLKGNIYAAGGQYHKQYKGFELKGEFGVNITGDFDGNFLKGTATFNLNEDIAASASLNHSSKAPNYNALLYQSDYIAYNWQNNFNNIETQQLAFKLKYKNWANITVDLNTINDYVYFKKDEISLQVRPFQNNATITYLRAKFENEIKVGKFALNNTVLYQNMQDDNHVLNVPELTTRNTLYFSSHVFKKAMYLQTGVTLNYFTKYYMNAYNPLLAEFYVQTDREFGNFPRLDFFLNAKIRQTRLYFKAEHLNSSFTGYRYYSSPNYPYRDFTIRFGLVWNFFL